MALKQKKVLIVLAFFAFVASSANAANCTNGQRTCFCSSNYANSVPINSSSRDVGCFQFKTQCDQRCLDQGYKSSVLFDVSLHSPNTETNPLNINDTRNRLNTLPGLTAPAIRVSNAGSECSSGRPCICSNDFINATKVGCYQLKTECDSKCRTGGYAQSALVNVSLHSPQILTEPLNLNDSRNALSVLPTVPDAATPDIGAGGVPATGIVPGTTTDTGGLIKCGRPGQPMCHLCDMVIGFNNIIRYLMRIAIGAALLAICVGGVIYIISAGDSGLMDLAKKAITYAIGGFVVIFIAFLLINTTMRFLGTKAGLGINATGWDTFECSSNPLR